jgi:hypothetical protein
VKQGISCCYCTGYKACKDNGWSDSLQSGRSEIKINMIYCANAVEEDLKSHTTVIVNIQDFFDCLTLKKNALYTQRHSVKSQKISVFNQVKPVGNR